MRAREAPTRGFIISLAGVPKLYGAGALEFRHGVPSSYPRAPCHRPAPMLTSDVLARAELSRGQCVAKILPVI